MLSTKNKTIRKDLEGRLDVELVKSNNHKERSFVSENMPKRSLNYEALETENIIQREEIEYLKRVNSIQHQ
jgi:hypothetical protein